MVTQVIFNLNFMFMAGITNCVSQILVIVKSKEFLNLEGLLSTVQAAKDNLNTENFTIKMWKCLRLILFSEWPTKQ